MTDKKEKNQASTKVSHVTTGIAGVVIGAGVAVAATALKDKKTQQKVKNALKTAGTSASKYITELKTNAAKQQKNIEGKTEEVEKEIKKATSDAQEKAQ
jgi:hypothetical protein